MHSHIETWEDCTECGAKTSLIKLIPKINLNLKKEKKYGKIGQATEEFIKEARKDLQKQKEALEKKRQ